MAYNSRFGYIVFFGSLCMYVGGEGGILKRHLVPFWLAVFSAALNGSESGLPLR